MFVYSHWERICKELSNTQNCILANQILDQDQNTKWVVVKHDVETNVAKALKLAKIESKYNIKATYYVQSYLLKDNKADLKEISSLGHEVSYHYDVLDSNNGNYINATSEFQKTLQDFKELGFVVSTVCPHGNPIINRDGWSSNKDFFRNTDISKKFPEILDIVVHLPSKLEKNYIYISDAAYSWKIISNVEDNDIENKGDEEITDFFKVLSENTECLIISTHPHRWQSSIVFVVFKTLFFKIIRFIARLLAKLPFIKNILSRYYYLAKKI